ncbi:MAG: FHA domain-containing protein [bacterium]
MALILTMEKGEPAGAVFTLTPGETILGRSSSAAVRLGSPDISGLHAKITVTGTTAVLENLSRFGTQLNGEDVAGRVTLSKGQRIGVGKATVLIFQQVEERGATLAQATLAASPETRGTVAGKGTIAAAPPFPPAVPAASLHEAATGKGIPPPQLPRIAPADDKTRAMPSGGAHEAEPMSRPDWTTEVGAEGETRAMQTRAVSPEEIEFLKVAEHKKVRQRMTLGLAIAIPLLLLVIIFRPRTPPPEKEFEWPKNAAGDYLDAFEPSPSGGFKDGGFNISYPGTEGASKKSIPGGVAVSCKIGRDLDIPMQVILQEELDRKFANMTRAAMVEDWMQQMAASGGRWNFDKPSLGVAFLGKENGIPTVRITYQRDGDGSWFGVATLMRHGIRRIAIRAEAPSVERVRAERILSAKFMSPSIDFCRSYWEPVQDLPKIEEADILRRVRQELDRVAPATWGETDSLLAGLLTKVAREGNADVETQALQLLARLREREALWFNSQQLAFDAAVMQGSPKRAKKIAEFTKGIFSNEEDQRYNTVRKWKTEP